MLGLRLLRSTDGSAEASAKGTAKGTEGRFDIRGLSDRIAALAGSLTVHQDDGDVCQVTLTLPATAASSHTRRPKHPSTQRPEEQP
jgi:hypothetical protein